MVDPYFVKPGRDFPAGEFDFAVSVCPIIGTVDEAGAVTELVDVLEAIGVEREVFGDVNIGEL